MNIEKNILSPVNRSTEHPYGLQKDGCAYYQPDYLEPARMSSYGYQFKLAYDSGGRTFINVGSGNHVVSDLLRANGKFIVDFDLDFFTKPDVVGTFPFLPFGKNSFDVALCFQVLEHFPFSMLVENLKELVGKSSKVILSLPDVSRSKNEQLKYLLYKKINFPKEWSIYRQRSINREHFWEIGVDSVDINAVFKSFYDANMEVQNHFRNPLNRYHHFFILRGGA